MGTNDSRAEGWLTSFEADLPQDAGVGALVAGGGELTPALPAAGPARLVRHAEDLLIELHSIAPDDQPARQSVEHELDRVIAKLPPDATAVVRALRRDLATLDGADLPNGAPVPPDLPSRVRRAWLERDCVHLLALLRLAPEVIPEATRALGRGRAWGTLGFLRACVLFFEHAAGVSDAPEVHVQLLDALVRAGRALDAADRAEAILERGAPLLLELAATRALFVAVRTHPRGRRPHEYARVLRWIDDVIRRHPGPAMSARSSLVAADVTRGMALDHLQRHAEARAAFDRAVERDPTSEAARLARGMHLVLHAGGDFRDDLAAAVGAGTAFVPAYLFLAHRLLDETDFAACAEVCAQGLALPLEERYEAALREMWAIAIIERGGDRKEALRLMERAAALAPDNARIVENLRVLRDIAATRDSAKPALVRGLDIEADANLLEGDIQALQQARLREAA